MDVYMYPCMQCKYAIMYVYIHVSHGSMYVCLKLPAMKKHIIDKKVAIC